MKLGMNWYGYLIEGSFANIAPNPAKNISYSTDHRQKIGFLEGLPITLASSLSPLNVPKTGFPWSIPPDLARLTPSDRYPELDNNNFSPCLGTFDPNSPKFPDKFPRRGGTSPDLARFDPLRSIPTGFFPITGNKYFVLYLRQPGFSGSQTKNISYSADHRQKIFRTLPQMAWGALPPG